MTIMVTGGGSGGHIIPILAVASEIKARQKDATIIFVGQTGDSLIDIPQKDPDIDQCYTIPAGKFRRYHGEGWQQLLDIKTQYLNVRDLIKTITGIWFSWRLMAKTNPDVVFTRGGFVSVPVALAAKLRRIPYITHDSDSTPSLANRIIAKWAVKHAVAMPEESYPYPRQKTVRVGIPIASEYKHVGPKELQVFRKALGLDMFSPIILVTGGGNGAKKLNDIILNNSEYLLKKYPKLAIVHIAGRTLAKALTESYDVKLAEDDRSRVIVKDFVNDLYRYSGAADIVIARGGATNLAEFSAQAKACIIIPSKQLIWNVRNAEALAKEKAIVELSEDQAEQERRLSSVIIELLSDKQKLEKLSQKFAQFSNPNATADIVELIFDVAQQNK